MSMEFYKWLGTKPKFDTDCICICATLFKTEWQYNSYFITEQDGEPPEGEQYDENVSYYYYAWCEMDGDEIDDLSEMKADKYFIIPFLKEEL